MSITPIVKPNEFTAHTDAASAEVNENFDVVYAGVNTVGDAINTAAGTSSSLAGRLSVAMNQDGTLKTPIAAGNSWVNLSLVPTRTSSLTFTTLGDYSNVMEPNQRIGLEKDTGEIFYTTVSTASFDGVKTNFTVFNTYGLIPIATYVNCYTSVIKPVSSGESPIDPYVLDTLDSGNAGSLVRRTESGALFTTAYVGVSTPIGNIPLDIVSTTMCPNLNVQYLNGKESTAFATAAQGFKADNALAASSYTADDVLTKIKTVDGSGSGLDADIIRGLRVISGTVASDGTSSGTGFTSVKNSTGSYTLTFSPAFGAAPQVMLIPISSNNMSMRFSSTPTTTTAAIIAWNQSGPALADTAFQFIAIGAN